MRKPMNLKEIVKKNPRINRVQLADSLKVSEALKREGFVRPASRLVPPFARKPATVCRPPAGEWA